MASSIHKMLWGAFAALTILVIGGVSLMLLLLQSERREEARIVLGSEPLIDSVQEMDTAITQAVAAARGFVLNQRSEFTQSYDDAVRDFEKNYAKAMQHVSDAQDRRDVEGFKRHFDEIRPMMDKQVDVTRDAADEQSVIEVARKRRSADDFAGMLTDRHRARQTQQVESLGMQRQWVMLLIVLAGVAIIGSASIAILRIERSIVGSIEGQVKRTEAMIAGMADGVMLVDAEGRTVFINPAGEKLLGRGEIGVPIFKQPDVYHLRNDNGERINPDDLPAAQALATGRAVRDKTMLIERDGRSVAISMSATPLHEDRHTTGAIVTFRDITERRRLEEEMQLQAERAQTLADAGAFFSSNIDPVWVTQAIAERVAEVLGDWAAVILKSADSHELRVASIYHRDMASLGLAWSYIYRQPLIAGEGIIGQVVATGFPSLTTNIAGVVSEDTGYRVGTSQHANPMKLASLLILPLRTRREMLGAIVIAANDPDRVMTDEKLPLAEVLAERAALAIENAKLYTDQVEARRKVEDLSRLKDEFLSIASHELRTPVTSIKGYTQLAKTLIRENDLATSEEYLDIALDQIDRMSRLILELLDVSRIETGRLQIRRESIAWPNFVRDVVHRHHTAFSDRHFKVDVDGDERVVNGDRDRLEQVLGNLLENAVKYSPEGSDISVDVDDRGDHVVTAVSDRGMGIPADELGQVFERFHRGRHVSSTNYGGLGLGLYITKQIVERHGGQIWVESREGQGTTFYFSLPATPVTATAQAAAGAAS
jgi:PAS domain S-box-containing protein